MTSVGFGQLDKAPLLTQAPVKTASYTATANQVVPVDTTSGNVTITLPNAPAGGTMMAVKHIIQGGTNTVTVACGGADVLNKTGGSVSMTLTLLSQGVLLEYNTGIWVNLADDLPLSQLDLRYTTPAALTAETARATAAESANTTAIAANTAAVALKAPLASPALTGTPTSPTQTPGDSSTKIATDAFVAAAVALLAPLASPALTGTPTAPTQTTGDTSTRLATDAFVATAVTTETTRATVAEAAAITTAATAAAAAYAPKAGVAGVFSVGGVLTAGGGVATAGSAPVLTPTFASGTAAQLSDLTRDYFCYFQTSASGTFSLAIGPANTTVNTIFASATLASAQMVTFRLPSSWWVKWSGTATLTQQKAIGC